MNRRAGQPGFAGAGAPRAFGGGGASPYRAGSRTPIAGIGALFLVGAALAFWPGMWLYGAHSYHFNDDYRFHNETTDNDENLPVICACDPYNPCGCEENNETEYVRDLVGTGAYDQLNHSQVTVAEGNGTKTLLINGTLPNGTEPPVPEDGDDDDDGGDDESVGPRTRAVIEALGYWPMVALVVSVVFLS